MENWGDGGFRRPGGELLSGCPERSQRGTRGKRNRQARLRRPCLHAAYPWTPFYGGPIRRVFRLSQRRGWFSRLVSLLLPLPLRVRSPLGVSSIGGKRAFWGGGAQVVRWGNGGRVRTPAPAKYREHSGLSAEAGHFRGLLRIFCGFGPTLIRLAFGQPPSPL